MVSTRSTSQSLSTGLDTTTPTTNNKRAKPPTTTTTSAPSRWSHAPTTLTLAWLAVSLPLVAWDTLYVLGRPHTMPGGALHWPLWAPYALYGEVDHMYGAKQWRLGNGFTAAQGVLNLVESALYAAYLAVAGRRRQGGSAAAWAVLLGFAASVMTVSKTVLYWLNEGFSGFDNIGHNNVLNLVFLWIIPNGAWIIFPSFMIYQFGSDIMAAIEIASMATGSVKEE